MSVRGLPSRRQTENPSAVGRREILRNHLRRCRALHALRSSRWTGNPSVATATPSTCVGMASVLVSEPIFFFFLFSPPPTFHLLLFPCKSNESLPFSFESCYELRSETGYDRAFGASISPSWSITSHSAALQTDFLPRRRPLQTYPRANSRICLAKTAFRDSGGRRRRGGDNCLTCRKFRFPAEPFQPLGRGGTSPPSAL